MMFFKLIRYDLKVGFSTTYKRYLAAVGLFAIIFVSFQLSVYGLNAVVAPEEHVQYNFGNLLMFAFGGMQEYIPSPGVPFQFPAFWMLIYLLLAYTTLYYPFNDLEEFGQSILVRSGGRRLWWFSKCIWNIVSVISFFLLAWGILAIGCLITGNSFSMDLSMNLISLLKLDGIMYTRVPSRLILQSLLLPPLVMTALNLFQMTLSLFIKPFYSYIVTVTILLTSAYYLSPFFLGNYAMPLRSSLMVENGVDLTAGILFSTAVILLCILVGGFVFQRRDILKGDH